jgi:hypothetical protein
VREHLPNFFTVPDKTGERAGVRGISQEGCLLNYGVLGRSCGPGISRGAAGCMTRQVRPFPAGPLSGSPNHRGFFAVPSKALVVLNISNFLREAAWAVRASRPVTTFSVNGRNVFTRAGIRKEFDGQLKKKVFQAKRRISLRLKADLGRNPF